jgi:hypothetical protein
MRNHQSCSTLHQLGFADPENFLKKTGALSVAAGGSGFFLAWLRSVKHAPATW